MSFKTEKGSVLLNPSEKALKYSVEIKHKKAITNDNRRKMDKKTGKQKTLSEVQLAYRAGYLAHQKDSAKAFKSKHPNYKRKTTNRHGRVS